MNGKCYVGQTIHTFHRRYHGKWWKYGNRILRAAYEKYGSEAFEIIVLKDCDNIEELNKFEVFFAKELNSYQPFGYNIKGCGDNRTVAKESRDLTSISVACSNGQKYDSMAEASRFLNIKQGHISEHLQGFRRQVSGYTFAIFGESPPPLPIEKRKNIPKRLKCSNGKIYDTCTFAAKDLGVSPSLISMALKDGKKVKGFILEID